MTISEPRLNAVRKQAHSLRLRQKQSAEIIESVLEARDPAEWDRDGLNLLSNRHYGGLRGDNLESLQNCMDHLWATSVTNRLYGMIEYVRLQRQEPIALTLCARFEEASTPPDEKTVCAYNARAHEIADMCRENIGIFEEEGFSADGPRNALKKAETENPSVWLTHVSTLSRWLAFQDMRLRKRLLTSLLLARRITDASEIEIAGTYMLFNRKSRYARNPQSIQNMVSDMTRCARTSGGELQDVPSFLDEAQTLLTEYASFLDVCRPHFAARPVADSLPETPAARYRYH